MPPFSRPDCHALHPACPVRRRRAGRRRQSPLPLDALFRCLPVRPLLLADVRRQRPVAARPQLRRRAVCRPHPVPPPENPLLQTAALGFRLPARLRLAQLGNPHPLQRRNRCRGRPCRRARLRPVRLVGRRRGRWHLAHFRRPRRRRQPALDGTLHQRQTRRAGVARLPARRRPRRIPQPAHVLPQRVLQNPRIRRRRRTFQAAFRRTRAT